MISLSFNGWSIVEGGSPGLVRLDGVESIDDVASGNVRRSLAPGSVTGPLIVGEKTIVAEVLMIGSPESIRAQVDALASATTIPMPASPLVWQLPGMTVARQADVRVHRRSVPVDIAFTLNKAEATIQFVATDPRIYAAGDSPVGPGELGLHTESTGVGSVSGGLGMPHGMPHGFGDVDPGAIDTTNGGNTAAPWTATLFGPLTAPTITLGSTGERLSWQSLTVADGQTLEIDSQARTAKLNGTATRFPAPDRDWFEIPVGADQVILGASSGTGTLQLSWRDAWL